MRKITRARKIMRKAFERDADFKQGYVANIAMCIHDNAKKGDDSRSYNRRNMMAKKILKLIFD